MKAQAERLRKASELKEKQSVRCVSNRLIAPVTVHVKVKESHETSVTRTVVVSRRVSVYRDSIRDGHPKVATNERDK